MAETTLDLRGLPKPQAYREAERQFRSVMEGVEDRLAGMATLNAILHHGFGHLWTGFYLLTRPDLLRVGPYQGTLGCLEIAVGKGVCGTAASEGRTVIVPDVHAFPGHISCDPRSRSEIVVPVWDARNHLLAVLDIDSDAPATFDAEDQRGLESMVRWFSEAQRS
jgi:L-methionine (R)-S-oxide reductase